MKKPIRLKVNCSKFNYEKDITIYGYKTLINKIKKEYNAEECYLENNKIIITNSRIVGTWKSTRIDGAKV